MSPFPTSLVKLQDGAALGGFRVQEHKPEKAGQFASQIVHGSALTIRPIKPLTFSWLNPASRAERVSQFWSRLGNKSYSVPCLRRARDIDGIDGRIAEYPIRVFGAGETRALGGRRGAGGLTKISSGDVGEAPMRLHLGEKLPPDSTKANDSDMNF